MAHTLPTIAWPRLVYDESALVAFVMAFHGVQWPSDLAGVARSGLWRLNVDASRRRQGYGRFAVNAVCTDLQARGERACFVTCDPGEDGPEGFDLGLGFRPTGESSGQQVVACLDL